MREAVAAADCWAEALRLLGMRVAGGNHKTIQKWVARCDVSTAHFSTASVRARMQAGRRQVPIAELLVKGSTCKRARLKERLYGAGLKERACEMCGQGEDWRGHRITLILDHINGDATDNRLENLRIACPNCAATFDTHCGKNKNRRHALADCAHCGECFAPKYGQQRYCSVACAKADTRRLEPRPETRKVERPSYEQLMAELAATNWSAVGRKYGVSDNAVRKWVRAYERRRLDVAA